MCSSTDSRLRDSSPVWASPIDARVANEGESFAADLPRDLPLDHPATRCDKRTLTG